MGLELFDVCERGAFLYHGVDVSHSMLYLQPRIGVGALICSLQFHTTFAFFQLATMAGCLHCYTRAEGFKY